MPMFGCPLIESTQRSPTTAKRIIQRPPCDVQNERKRGGVTCDVGFQLNCEQPRAAAERQVSRIPEIQCEATERPASPAAREKHST
jgi:hypothetical protein